VKKVLVANRGEIALRVLRAVREAGLVGVAVHTAADADLPFVRAADEAVEIGAGPPRESYLDGAKIVRAALERRCDAVHPGYGFLSENAAFAAAVEAAGLVFVGPRPETIALMGKKARAREIMREAGVPVLPGSGELRELREAEAAADSIGYPVILKATAGGGGIGMVVCETAADLRRHFAPARERAEKFFGDDALYLERWLERPRHVEVQVLGDAEGNVIHLFERECSIQRRHQKVLEEAAAPALAGREATRERLLLAAIEGAARVRYRSAGTIEFLYDPRDDRFFFMEMNTRLQVEHPVTEMTTGIDIVRAQLEIAMGGPLPARQADLRRTGHAIEARVCAEDPARGFLPCPGQLGAVAWPSGEGVRCDAGYETGNRVTPFYDSLLGKLIAHGRDRAEALARLLGALERTEIEGIRTNLGLLRRLAADAELARGEFDTGFLTRRKDLFS
jgi:acetyl-CoA carboxylase biotin carboxylase subunit